MPRHQYYCSKLSSLKVKLLLARFCICVFSAASSETFLRKQNRCIALSKVAEDSCKNAEEPHLYACTFPRIKFLHWEFYFLMLSRVVFVAEKVYFLMLSRVVFVAEKVSKMQHHLDAYNKTRQQETTIILASFPGHKATSILCRVVLGWITLVLDWITFYSPHHSNDMLTA